MENNDLLQIKLKVFELQEPLIITIPRDKEELYRKALVNINEAIKQYRQRYQTTPFEQILSMALLSLAVKSQDIADDKAILPLVSELESMDAALKGYLDIQISE